MEDEMTVKRGPYRSCDPRPDPPPPLPRIDWRTKLGGGLGLLLGLYLGPYDSLETVSPVMFEVDASYEEPTRLMCEMSWADYGWYVQPLLYTPVEFLMPLGRPWDMYRSVHLARQQMIAELRLYRLYY